MNYRGYCWYICHKFLWGSHCCSAWVCSHWVQPHKHPLLVDWLWVHPLPWRCKADSLSEIVRNVGLTWQLWDMLQRDTAHLKPTENPPPSGWSQLEGRGVSDEKCASTSLSVLLCCGHLLGGRPQLPLVTLLCHPAGTTRALSADRSCSPDHLHLELIWPWDATVHLSNHLKQNHFYDHFLWRDLWKSYMGVYFQHTAALI